MNNVLFEAKLCCLLRWLSIFRGLVAFYYYFPQLTHTNDAQNRARWGLRNTVHLSVNEKARDELPSSTHHTRCHFERALSERAPSSARE